MLKIVFLWISYYKLLNTNAQDCTFIVYSLWPMVKNSKLNNQSTFFACWVTPLTTKRKNRVSAAFLFSVTFATEAAVLVFPHAFMRVVPIFSGKS